MIDKERQSNGKKLSRVAKQQWYLKIGFKIIKSKVIWNIKLK